MKTWFITGTSSGIGRTLTEALLARGQRVAATLRDVSVLSGLQARYADTLWTAALDVTDAHQARAVAARAFADLGRIDVVVSNAGYGLFGAAEEVTDEQIERQIATNLTGSIHVVRATLPHLRKQGGGRILQVSSEGGQTTYPAFSLYHATKWGVEGFIQAVAAEVAPFGIACTLIEFGPTATNFRGSIVAATPMAAYEETAVGEFRRAARAGSAFPEAEDPATVAQAMIDVADRSPAPLRLAVGTYALTRVRSELRQRLDAMSA
jgi:NAD(P)-dependent dehydrogenase (short-subunit alcohol dehydrogenase family)